MRRLTLCALVSLFVLIEAACAQDTLRFSGFDAPNLTPEAERILSRAYEELGIRIETVKLSPRRALLDSASGKTDGELVRVKIVGTAHESLIRVDVPIIEARTYAYASKPELRGKPFGELKHLRIGHVAGARFASELADGFSEVWTAETPEQLFEMLLRDRLDLVIVGEGTGRRVIREREIKEVFHLTPSLRTVSFYHYLHEKHAALVPRIEAVLRRQLEEEREARPDDNVPGEEAPEKKVLHRIGMT
jgi:ABC-type amino acid transport substrate-binding protein